MSKVTTIPASRPMHANRPATQQTTRRVAGYARVSTDMEEQSGSYAAQVSYYTDYIQNHADWELAGIYTDEGISGTSTAKRGGFRSMVQDALAGKIDLIVTKSVSRFARNTVDSLTTVRNLKDAGVEVFFEKENIWTFDSKGELLITIMSSLAQEESRSISENVTWGHRRAFANGRVMVPYSSLLGYKKGEDGGLAIDESQAKVVRRIYSGYLSGHAPARIARELTAEGIPTPRGKTKWTATTIRSILKNEKYKGDALLQKSLTVDFLTKKTKVNEGEVPQYYVTGNHEAIIDPAVWEQVQRETERRKNPSVRSSHPFAAKIRCGGCGGWFGRKTWHSTSKYARHIWRCNNKYEGDKTGCTTPHVTETQVEEAFVAALAERLDRETVGGEVLAFLDATVFNTSKNRAKLAKLEEEVEGLVARINGLVSAGASKALNPDQYEADYRALEMKYLAADKKRNDVAEAIADLEHRSRGAHQVHDYLQTQPPLTYTPEAWTTLVAEAEVSADGTISVRFADEVRG
ncbi:recombinase family protein [Actinomyces minihominis]|uniref:recombinase family protein n=1 Tax=Actinomyces minihominis TaxID=2002838 RepID=UPI000C083018|nr:recombinase family protein [Actinomyces minihominis]